MEVGKINRTKKIRRVSATVRGAMEHTTHVTS